MPSARPYFVVDAFADRPFRGNPAAVVPLDAWPDDEWLQSVAAEMNLAETAFLVPTASGFDLRWFTPLVEVDLCGHATLAAARALAASQRLEDDATVNFSTRSGMLPVARRGDWYELDFPLQAERPVSPPPGLLEALGVAASYVGRGPADYLVEIASEGELRELRPDFRRLAKIDCRGVIVTTRGNTAEFDFLSRFLAPAVGIDEDPVTGSAHCCLADFWGRRLGKTSLTGYQASRRGGIVRVEVRGERALLRGQGVLVARGELLAE